MSRETREPETRRTVQTTGGSRAIPYVLFGVCGFALAVLFQFGSLLLGHNGEPLDMIRPARTGGAIGGVGFDGAYFLALAKDPLVRPDTAATLDSPLIRARRIGVPLAARALSPIVGGVAPALLVVLALSSAATIYLVQLGARRNAVHPALCLSAALALPLVLSTEFVTSELPATACMLGAAEFHRRGRAFWAVALLSAACLTKEVMALAVLAFIVCELRGRKVARAWLLATALAPLAAWDIYLVAHLGGAPQTGSLLANLTFPGRGLIGAITGAATQLIAGPGAAKASGVLLAVSWLASGAVLSFALVSTELTPGRVLACLGGLLVILLSRGAPAYAYDEIFNFGRQLFLLPVGMFTVFFIESNGMSRKIRLSVATWLAAGAFLAVAWWVHKIWVLSTHAPST